MSDTGRLLRFANGFAISCGTVTIDTTTTGLPILVVQSRRTGEIFLRKGRKNINESLRETAWPETFEETS